MVFWKDWAEEMLLMLFERSMLWAEISRCVIPGVPTTYGCSLILRSQHPHNVSTSMTVVLPNIIHPHIGNFDIYQRNNIMSPLFGLTIIEKRTPIQLAYFSGVRQPRLQENTLNSPSFKDGQSLELHHQHNYWWSRYNISPRMQESYTLSQSSALQFVCVTGFHCLTFLLTCYPRVMFYRRLRGSSWNTALRSLSKLLSDPLANCVRVGVTLVMRSGRTVC
jgi:hypothetical protein